MRPLTSIFSGLILALSNVAAPAANVAQSGNVTPGHLTAWTTNGVVQDAGTATNPFANTFGLIGGPFCIDSGPTTGAYNAFCFQAHSTNGGTVSLYNHGGATGGIAFSINGVAQGIPLISLPTTIDNIACFSNTTGTLKNCTAPIAPTPSAGDNSTRVATTAFVAQNSSQGTSVLAYGAVCDGTTDDHTAINTALAAGGAVSIPPGKTCITSTALNITVSGTQLFGSGMKSSCLSSSTANAIVISVAAGVNNVSIHDLCVKHKAGVTPTSPGDGIFFNGETRKHRSIMSTSAITI